MRKWKEYSEDLLDSPKMYSVRWKQSWKAQRGHSAHSELLPQALQIHELGVGVGGSPEHSGKIMSPMYPPRGAGGSGQE